MKRLSRLEIIFLTIGILLLAIWISAIASSSVGSFLATAIAGGKAWVAEQLQRSLLAFGLCFLIAGSPWIGISAWKRWFDAALDSRFFTEMPSRKRMYCLFLISFTLMFLEMTLVRWIAVELRIFAYFKNLALLACFLGFSFGCLYRTRPVRLLYSIAFLALFVIAASPSIDLGLISPRSSTVLLGKIESAPIWMEFRWSHEFLRIGALIAGLILTAGMVVLLAVIFFPFGQMVGNLMDESTPLRSYSWNIAGSLLGVWAFYLVSSISLPPPYWFVISIASLLPFLAGARRRLIPGCLLGVIAILASAQIPKEGELIRWSPYQKLVLRPSVIEGRNIQNGYFLEVNHAYYQHILNLSDEFRGAHPDLFPPQEIPYDSYDLPFAVVSEPRSVLIVGAGSGNDVSAVLRHTRTCKVTAVEIDPEIVELGKRMHPEKPYQNPRVRVVVDDARAFFEKSKEKFDVVIFGLLDSHTLGSGLTNLRLDNYVYTRESFDAVKNLLAPGGLVFVKFAVNRPWIGAKLYMLLGEVFGFDPFVFRLDLPAHRGWGGDCLVTGSMDAFQNAVHGNSNLKTHLERIALQIPKEVLRAEPPSDDWPYLYVQYRSIPATYLWIMGILIFMAAIFWIIFRKDLVQRIQWHFFFLGAAFLLIEFQSIHRLSLFFGNTWIVTGMVISAIFIMILIANFLTPFMKRIPVSLLYVLLLAALLGAYFFPYRALLTFSLFTAGMIAGLFQALPILFSGLIFARSFQESSNLGDALGSNLAGSFAGGMLEAGTFLIGIRLLGLVALALYALSWLFRSKSSQ